MTNKREGILGSLTLQNVVQMSAFPFLPIWDERSCSRSSFNKGLCLVWWLFCFLDMLCSPYNHKWICPGGPAGPTAEKQKQEVTEKHFFPSKLCCSSHPAEIWCRKKYSSKVKKAIIKISWKGMILDWKGARCSPSGRTKGAILTLSGKWDSLDCWDSCFTARCFFKKRLLSQIPRTFNNGMLVPQTWFNLKSRAIWKQEGQI